MDVYDFKVLDQKGREVSMREYKGKVLLIVNTATGCGLTPQYEALEALYKEYKDKGLEILDFPCNQFLEQVPGDPEVINSFCSLNYNTTFKRFAKIDVNGPQTTDLFKWLKEQAPIPLDDSETQDFNRKVAQFTPGIKISDIHWNFNKFLIGKDGKVIARFSPTYTPDRLSDAIQKALLA